MIKIIGYILLFLISVLGLIIVNQPSDPDRLTTVVGFGSCRTIYDHKLDDFSDTSSKYTTKADISIVGARSRRYNGSCPFIEIAFKNTKLLSEIECSNMIEAIRPLLEMSEHDANKAGIRGVDVFSGQKAIGLAGNSRRNSNCFVRLWDWQRLKGSDE